MPEPDGTGAGGTDIGLAVVGLGYWGPNRLRVLMEEPSVEVAWMCDRDEARLAHHARRYPAVRCTTSFEETLDDPTVDGVVIATPVFTHAPLVSAALEAGKHVFVEKPLAASVADAERLVETAESAGLVLMVGHTFLYSPPVRLVKRLLDEGALGDLHYISSSRVNLGPYRSDVSVLFDLGPHDFSILLYWLGELPDQINAAGRAVIAPGIADVAFVTARFGELIANVELSWLSPSKLRRTVVVGSEQMLVYEDGSAEPVRLFDSGIEYRDPETYGEYHLAYRTGDIVSPRVEPDEPIAIELGDFVSALRGEHDPVSTARFGVDVIRMVEAAEASLANSGHSVSLRDPVAPPSV
jgi:predicted dehydrogenase